MTAQQLKNSILQMAVQGKLVPQNPDDERASVLLERIRAEKEALIKVGKIKREKNPSVIFRGADGLPYEKVGGGEPVCIVDEVPFEIPDSWEWVHLNHVAVSDLGKTLDKAKNTGNYQPYLCSINIYWDGIDLSKVKEARFEDSELPKYLLKKGDLLICEGGEVGRACVWDEEIPMYYQNALHRVRFLCDIIPYYFKYLIECYKSIGIIDEYSKGMTIKHLVQNSLHSIYFPLPPLAEQHRIVAKIEELLPCIAKYDQAESQLSALNAGFPAMLKKSILQEAVQGRLVPQNPDDESAAALLERIRKEKARLVREGKIKKGGGGSVIFRRDGSHYERLDDGSECCIDDEVPFEIPEGWEWVRCSSIGTIVRGSGIKRTETAEQGLPCIRYGEIYTSYNISFTQTKSFVPKDLYEKCKHISYGDIVFTLTGENKPDIAKAIAYFGETPVAAGGDLAFWTCHGMNPLYLMYFLNSPYAIERKIQLATGDIIVHISGDKIGSILLPLPPLAEQKRIVAKIEELMRCCEML